MLYRKEVGWIYNIQLALFKMSEEISVAVITAKKLGVPHGFGVVI